MVNEELNELNEEIPVIVQADEEDILSDVEDNVFKNSDDLKLQTPHKLIVDVS